MTISTPGTIDFVAHDPSRDEALLVMVEDRSWGDAGALLPDLQAKLNLYLDYATTPNSHEPIRGLPANPFISNSGRPNRQANANSSFFVL